MSKIALITDLHFGVRGGRAVFHDFFQRFYLEVLFPFMRANNIKHILNLGDTFDSRKGIDFYSLQRCREYFFDPLRDNGFTMDMLVGNHDAYHKNSLSINAPENLLKDYANVNPISKPTEISVDGLKILMMPWICADNYADSMESIKQTKATLLMGHLEIAGALMYRGSESHDGFDKRLFTKFDLVCSGHYHHRSSFDNVVYLGNPYEITWQDYNDQRGFHVLDTETRELTFYPNPFTIHERVVYDDTQIDPAGIDLSAAAGKFLKIVVQKKTDFYKFDLFIDRAYNCNAVEVKIIDDAVELLADDMDETVDIESTEQILTHYVKTAEVDVDRAKLERYIQSLYSSALSTET